MNSRTDIINDYGFKAARIAVLLLSLLALGVSLNVGANERLDANAMRKQVEQAVMRFLQAQTQGYPGKVNIQLQPLDTRIHVQACDQLEPFSMQGSRLWGKTHVGVRCRANANQHTNQSAGQKPWSLYMQADVQVFGQYAVTAVPVSQGQVLSARDIVMQSGDLTRLPNGILTDANMVEGKLASINLSTGTVLRPELLKATTVIQQGQTVQVSSTGEGFVVSADGTAMNTAQPGQVVQVKVASGQTIKGIAKDIGRVEVSN